MFLLPAPGFSTKGQRPPRPTPVIFRWGPHNMMKIRALPPTSYLNLLGQVVFRRFCSSSITSEEPSRTSSSSRGLSRTKRQGRTRVLCTVSGAREWKKFRMGRPRNCLCHGASSARILALPSEWRVDMSHVDVERPLIDCDVRDGPSAVIPELRNFMVLARRGCSEDDPDKQIAV